MFDRYSRLFISVFFIIVLLVLVVNGYIWSRKKSSLGQSDDSSSSSYVTVIVYRNGDWTKGQSIQLSKEECNSKEELADIVCPKVLTEVSEGESYKGCSLFSPYGTRTTSCSELKMNENAVFVVPEGRLFMMPTQGIGYKLEIQHIGMPTGKPIILETLSVTPRIFRILNFFTEEESDALIENALTIKEESHRLKRSSTGATGYTVDNKRTSEGAFDTTSEVAVALKKRTFDLLGIFPYDESYADGLQILRYNQSTAYDSHMDWISINSRGTENSDHDYDSEKEGTNRFATVILYLSDVESGGETVFPDLYPLNFTRSEGFDYDEHQPYAKSSSEALAETNEFLDRENISNLFPESSWQRRLISQCRSRMSVVPKKNEAILFYSQHADGKPDWHSKHGGCPVIKGQKWAANLWVWNGPRNGYWRKNSVTGKSEKPKITSVSASFESKDVIGARLYWEDQLWEELSPERAIKVNTFAGHKWNVKIDNEVVMTWVIDEHKISQRFVLSSEDLPTYN